MKATVIAVLFLLIAGSLFCEDITLDYQGKKIILHDNKTWEYSSDQPTSENDTLILTKKTSQSELLTSSTKKFSINVDPLLWDPSKSLSESAEFGFENKAKNGFGMAIYDGLEIPLASMEKVLITNANSVDPNASIQSIQKCVVNGTAGELVTYAATSSGIPFTFLTFIASGTFGTIQYTFFTSASTFDSLKSTFVDMISGLTF